jgi:hypothetical protein
MMAWSRKPLMEDVRRVQERLACPKVSPVPGAHADGFRALHAGVWRRRHGNFPAVWRADYPRLIRVGWVSHHRLQHLMWAPWAP